MHDDLHLPGRGGGLASGDTVKVVRGPNAGSSGVLQGVDGNDAIVKLKTGIAIVPKDSITRI
jgi:ribosomal protein L24